MQKFKSVEELVNQLKPTEPVYCIRKKSIQLASKFFQNKFPGKVLYAVKTNPLPIVLKTIIALISAANVISSNYQVAIMAPTEILAKQHYNLAKKIFKSTNVTIELLTIKSETILKKKIKQNLFNGKTNLLIGVRFGGIKFQIGFNFIVWCLKLSLRALAKPSVWLIIPCMPCVKRSAFNSNISYYINLS